MIKGWKQDSSNKPVRSAPERLSRSQSIWLQPFSRGIFFLGWGRGAGGCIGSAAALPFGSDRSETVAPANRGFCGVAGSVFIKP